MFQLFLATQLNQLVEESFPEKQWYEWDYIKDSLHEHKIYSISDLQEIPDSGSEEPPIFKEMRDKIMVLHSSSPFISFPNWNLKFPKLAPLRPRGGDRAQVQHEVSRLSKI